MQRVGAVGFIVVEDTHGKGHISRHPPKGAERHSDNAATRPGSSLEGSYKTKIATVMLGWDVQ